MQRGTAQATDAMARRMPGYHSIVSRSTWYKNNMTDHELFVKVFQRDKTKILGEKSLIFGILSTRPHFF